MESKIKSDTKNITQVNVEKIMKLYESEVLPVVQYYAQKDLLVKINTELY
jgi:adenylate kinase family enzyme